MPFMEPEDMLLSSQKAATDPYPEPDESVYIFTACCFKIHFNIILPIHARSPK
jgi:hypothetical protein